MGLFPLKPARSQAMPDVEPFVDLDALIAEPVAFKWNGHAHFVRPIDTKTFLKVTNEMAKIDALMKAEKVSHKEVVLAYAGLFSSVCDTITLQDVYKMTPAQTGALLQMILSCVGGKAQKKTPVKEAQTTSA